MISYVSFPTQKSDPNCELVSVCHLGNATREMVEKYQINEKQRNDGYKEYKEEV